MANTACRNLFLGNITDRTITHELSKSLDMYESLNTQLQIKPGFKILLCLNLLHMDKWKQ